MIKLKTTKKAIKESGKKIIKVGYCDLQYLLNYKSAFAYSAGVDGWACDYYEFNNIIISTGYNPIGKNVNYDLLKEYEKKAFDIMHADYRVNNGNVKDLLDELIKEFLTKIEVCDKND